MRLDRASGVLLHPTSLPGPHGIGTLGASARAFVDFLADAGQRYWQVLPLGPTGYGDSPYQALSAFAGNPLLIDLDTLVDSGWMTPADLAGAPAFPDDRVDFDLVVPYVQHVLGTAFGRLVSAPAALRQAFEEFCHREQAWLDEYALYAAIKDDHGGAPWIAWERRLALRDPAALEASRQRLARQVEAARVAQFMFFTQWDALRAYARARGIAVIGDMPIFVAHDSADVWTRPDLFDLDPAGQPTAVAGVPPDYFSADGQLWGNPLYRWDAMAASGYRWWVERLRGILAMVDVVRLDHFRGFDAYWRIPWPARSAIDGQWVAGPGAPLFEALEAAWPDLPIIAENLGVITPAVEGLRHRFRLPGMTILQFAFGTDPQAPTFLPHNYTRDCVAYTGTHDNEPINGWWNAAGVGNTTRTVEDVEREHARARRYLHTDGRDMHWVCIRAVLASVAGLAMMPLQDVLGLGNEARMNVPAVPSGNWRWRYRREALTPALAARLRELTETYDRGRSSGP